MGVKRGLSGGWSVLALGLGVMSCMTVLSLAVPTARLSKRFETNGGTNNTLSNHESCIAGNKSYKSGEMVTENAGPCEECVCKPPNIQCTMVHCPVKTGCKIIQLPNQCCPQFQCDCEFNGRNYFNGEQIEAQLDKPCEVCYCKGGDVMCTSVTCYERSDCQAKVVPGQCCPKYENCPPRGVKELGHSDKTEGTIDDDSKTKKREMQPWLLTNPAEEVERHETTEINALTMVHNEDSSAGTTEERIAATEKISSNYLEKLSTEYRLLDDKSTYETTEKVELEDRGKVTSVSYDFDATEAYELSTQPERNESWDNSDLATNAVSTEKDSSLAIAATSSPVKFEKITAEPESAGATESYKALVSELTTEQTVQVTEHLDGGGDFKSALETDKKTSEIASEDVDENMKDSYTTSLAMTELDDATLATERIDQEANTASGTPKDILFQTVGSTVQPNSASINQDFKTLTAAVNNDEATNYDHKEINAEKETSSEYIASTTDAGLEGKVSFTTINSDLKQADVQTEDQKFKVELISQTETPSFTTIASDLDKYKVHLSIGQIEEKATVENVNANHDEERKENEHTEASIVPTTDYEELTTVLNDQDEPSHSNVLETVTSAAVGDDQKTQEKLVEDSGKILTTTESEESTRLVSDESSTNINPSYPEKATELKKDEKIGEEMKTISTIEMLQPTQEPLNDGTTELLVASTEKIVGELVKSDTSEEESQTKAQTTQTFVTDKTPYHNGPVDEPKISGNNLRKIEDSADVGSTTFRTDEKIQNEEALDTTSTYSDATTESELLIIDSLLKLVVSSALPPNDLDDKTNVPETLQNSEITTIENLKTEKEILPTTEVTYSTEQDSIQGLDKTAFLNAQLSPDQNDMENLAPNFERKPTDYTTNSDISTTYELDKISATEHSTDLISSLKQQSIGDNLTDANLNESSTETYIKPGVSSLMQTTEEYPITEDPKLVQSILNLALSMQTPDDNTMGIRPPDFIPIKYIGQSEENLNDTQKTTEINGSTTEINGSTTPFDKKTFSTFFTEKTEGTTEIFADTKQLEQSISKHVQNLTQLALTPMANKLLNLVNKGNKTNIKKGPAPQNVKDEIIMPKDSEIERIAEEIQNATILSFRDSFETLEKQLGVEPASTTKPGTIKASTAKASTARVSTAKSSTIKALKSTSQPVKHKADSAQSNLHKVRRRRNKVKTKK
ncbi:unnamed protein product [Bemisia tabaci]|uniref:VWFC domain-containing protein n=1 Tax=Bemisia tabaci TaxID=7038 RepID=A0A9P0AFQ9_BEMTA|nr:unnamed protein product [Bemisia tabaci]